jgi:hypothetical protein
MESAVAMRVAILGPGWMGWFDAEEISADIGG